MDTILRTPSETTTNSIDPAMVEEDMHSKGAADTAWVVVPPILLVLGTVANGVSITFLTRHDSRPTPSSRYLLALCVIDLVILYVGLLRQWVKYTFQYDVRQSSAILCKIHVLLVYAGLQASSWILVMITIERVCSVLYPCRVRIWFTKKVSSVVIFVIITLALLINSHALYGFQIRPQTTRNTTSVYCGPIPNYADFIDTVWPWVHFAVCFIVPFVILMIGNIIMVFKLRTYQTLRKGSVASIKSVEKLSRTVPYRTAMTVVLNSVFLLCVSPICIFVIGQCQWWQRGSEKDSNGIELAWAIVNMLMYTNNAVNAIMYFLSGSLSRRRLQSLFKPRRQSMATVSLTRSRQSVTSLQSLESVLCTPVTSQSSENFSSNSHQLTLSIQTTC